MLADISLLFKDYRWLITLCMDFASIERKLVTAQEPRRPVPFNRSWQGSWLTGASSSMWWWQLTGSLISILQLVKSSRRNQPYAAKNPYHKCVRWKLYLAAISAVSRVGAESKMMPVGWRSQFWSYVLLSYAVSCLAFSLSSLRAVARNKKPALLHKQKDWITHVLRWGCCTVTRNTGLMFNSYYLITSTEYKLNCGKYRSYWERAQKAQFKTAMRIIPLSLCYQLPQSVQLHGLFGLLLIWHDSKQLEYQR